MYFLFSTLFRTSTLHIRAVWRNFSVTQHTLVKHIYNYVNLAGANSKLPMSCHSVHTSQTSFVSACFHVKWEVMMLIFFLSVAVLTVDSVESHSQRPTDSSVSTLRGALPSMFWRGTHSKKNRRVCGVMVGCVLGRCCFSAEETSNPCGH